MLTHRYYDPTEGRFLTRDPIGYAGGQNLYAYVNGNPVNVVDPSGFQPGTEWADYTARYWEQKTRRAKEAVLDSNIGVCDATIVNTAIDVFDGIMQTPSAFAHLGEGLGCWAGGDHSPDAVCRAWGDVGTFSSTVLAVSLGPAMRSVRGAPKGVVESPRPALNFAEKQLQSKFKHAQAFGVEGNYSKANAQAFQSAIEKHVSGPDTRATQGIYRGQDATLYTDPNTGLAVIADTEGNFLSGWKLNPEQLRCVLESGRLGGR